ncbi:hypothetical protein [Anaerotruncus massiliensis (ex Liu et al. 2021)]|uniref:hypothetical protein n=1 Tax=Anaerotruncus massiliensis (ex Liu et al. 2021) TaxID=2321404 RepID=UPI003AB55A9C
MTLDQIEALDKDMLVPADIYEYLDTDPNTLRWQARNEPEKLGFPVIVTKSRIKIPKDGFVFFCRYGRPIIAAKEAPA